MSFPQALTIAGSDSGGGAGIQADLKTFQMCEVFGTSVLTAITAQNTLGVSQVQILPIEIIAAQLTAIASDFQINAFKIGMVGSAEIIEYLATHLRSCHLGKLVLDPVMVAKGGSPLLANNAVQVLKNNLLPIADIITPNIPETYALTGIEVRDKSSAIQAANKFQSLGVSQIIIKGGHSYSNICCDWVFLTDQQFSLESPRFNTPHTHGTGCTFSAYLTAQLARGIEMADAIYSAKYAITQAITSPLGIGNGHGAVNHWAMVNHQHNDKVSKCVLTRF